MNFTPYVFGLLYNARGEMLSTESQPNGNMIGSTTQFIFLSIGPKSPATDPLQLCLFRSGLSNYMPYLGLFTRYAHSQVNTSVDDYLSAACLKDLAEEIYYAGRKGFGFFDVNRPHKVSLDLTTFLFRFTGFWQHVKISAEKPIYPIGRFLWAFNIWLAARKPVQNQDGWVQSHLMILTAERRGYKSWIGSKAINYWRKKKPKPTWQIVLDYLGLPDHPLVEAWKVYE